MPQVFTNQQELLWAASRTDASPKLGVTSADLAQQALPLSTSILPLGGVNARNELRTTFDVDRAFNRPAGT